MENDFTRQQPLVGGRAREIPRWPSGIIEYHLPLCPSFRLSSSPRTGLAVSLSHSTSLVFFLSLSTPPSLPLLTQVYITCTNTRRYKQTRVRPVDKVQQPPSSPGTPTMGGRRGIMPFHQGLCSPHTGRIMPGSIPVESCAPSFEPVYRRSPTPEKVSPVEPTFAFQTSRRTFSLSLSLSFLRFRNRRKQRQTRERTTRATSIICRPLKCVMTRVKHVAGILVAGS